jgi:hypothetical protein
MYFSVDKISKCYANSSLILRQVNVIAKSEKWSKEKTCNYSKSISAKAIDCIKVEDQKNIIGSKLRDLLLTTIYNKKYSARYIVETHNKTCPASKF